MNRRWRKPLCLRLGPACLPALLLLAGCGAETSDSTGVVTRTDAYLAVDPPAGIEPAEILPQDAAFRETDSLSTTTTPAAIQRRIIYTTEIALVVKDYNVFEAKLPPLVRDAGGYIQKSETNRQYSDRQSGIWVARVPVDRYSEFLKGVTGLGFAESRREDAQDVTEEFVDVEARIRNSRQLEERIIAMLDERTGKITDVLEIERELARVREEIERMEGRLRLLSDRSDLATITIRCREEQQYVPPAAPTLRSRIQNSWSGSLDAMRTVAENLLVATVAAVPWLVLLSLPLLLVLLLLRRLTRR